MSGLKIGYVRVSSLEQHEDRQIAALESKGIDKWYVEKVSGKDMNRPQLQSMLDYVREGDTVYVHEFSRLGRSVSDLLEIVDTLQKKGVALISNKENLDTSTPTGKLMLTMMAAIAEFERACILERQREGIKLAKERGVYKGRREIRIPDFPEYYQRYLKREYNLGELAKKLGISRPTLNKLIEEEKKRLAAENSGSVSG